MESRKTRRGWWLLQGSFALFFFLLALAIGSEAPFLPISLVAVVVGALAFFRWAFPGSRAFAVGLANFLAVYACIFIFLQDSNFERATPWVTALSYVLAPLSFLLSVWIKRRDIRAIVTSEKLRDTGSPRTVFLWLLPLILLATATFWLPARDWDGVTQDALLLSSMAVIALLVAAVSHNICIFLIDSSLLFEHFYQGMSRLFVPAFAFLTFYSLLVIVFAALYRVIDRFTPAAQFSVHGVAQDLSFGDALYFSLVTLATVGYGDITPLSPAVRVVVALQVVLGLLLLLFGFAEIMRYLQNRDPR